MRGCGSRSATALAGVLLASAAGAQADGGWRAFRGTDGTARSAAAAPTRWSESKGVRWRRALPGPGTSSPIVVGDAVFVTCWSGYGLDRDAPGELAELRRHLLKIDRESGEVLWRRDVAPVASEDPFAGRMAVHGYASSTPVSDGQHVFVHFGKSGVLAYDMHGQRVWHASVGTGSSQWKTGSGASPALWRDLLLVNASDESHALVALDKKSGKEVWRRGAAALDQAYATPLVTGPADRPVLVFPILGEVWGLDPASGHTRWLVKTRTGGALAPSALAAGDRIVSFGGRTRTRSYAIRLGGSGDVTESHIAWQTRYGAYVTTPLLLDGRLYFGDDGGILHCMDAATGELLYKKRLGGSFYSSPVAAGDAVYLVSRTEGTFVVAPGAAFRLIAHNRIAGDATRFDATPAVSRGDLFLRSRRFLYCVGG